MATVATESVPTTGLDATYNAASAGGDKVAPDSIIHVKNGSGSVAVNVTMVTPQTVDGDLAVGDRVVNVPISSERFIRATSLYRDPADGLVALEWDATTSVTFAVIR